MMMSLKQSSDSHGGAQTQVGLTGHKDGTILELEYFHCSHIHYLSP